MSRSRAQPLLRIPPFPGARPKDFARAGDPIRGRGDSELDEAMRAMARLRVGGAFWAAQPPLPASYTLVAATDPDARSRALESAPSDLPVVCWSDAGRQAGAVVESSALVLTGPCDPWHLVRGAAAAIVDPDSELAIIAAIADVPIHFATEEAGSATLQAAFKAAAGRYVYFNPFTGEPMGPIEAVELLGFWRTLIDSNRDVGSALGFAFWKQPTVAPLLWGGHGPVPFHSRPHPVLQGHRIAAWKSRVAPPILAELEREGAELVEVEDGFIRSTGLGADCVPPLSIVVDRIGVHFDPSGPSELEELLEKGTFPPELLDRARALRQIIVDLGVSKYGSARGPAECRRSQQRHILVPGQVEDDRAVLAGSEIIGNAELLRRVRHDARDAYIIYKPHPDVEAGHRLGAVSDDLCSQLADEVVRGGPISSWIELVDEVQVNTSLAGFEALLRGKSVTSHGVPFYAGWGLTRDLGDIPQRRTARRSLDELVAAVLLLYPRYLDPITGLPCPPEILIRRLSEGGAAAGTGPVVQLRRLQGRLKRTMAALRFW